MSVVPQKKLERCERLIPNCSNYCRYYRTYSHPRYFLSWAISILQATEKVATETALPSPNPVSMRQN
jgi:hypothetical protein